MHSHCSLNSIQFSTLDPRSLLQGILFYAKGRSERYRGARQRRADEMARSVCIQICQLVIQNRHRTPSEVAEYLRSVFSQTHKGSSLPLVDEVLVRAQKHLQTHLNAWIAILDECGRAENCETFQDEILRAAAVKEVDKRLARRAGLWTGFRLPRGDRISA